MSDRSDVRTTYENLILSTGQASNPGMCMAVPSGIPDQVSVINLTSMQFSDQFCTNENEFCTYENQFCTYESQFCTYESQFALKKSILHQWKSIVQKRALIYIK